MLTNDFDLVVFDYTLEKVDIPLSSLKLSCVYRQWIAVGHRRDSKRQRMLSGLERTVSTI